MIKKNLLPSIDYQPNNYDQIFDQKVKDVCSLFAYLNIPKPSIFPSIKYGYRMRAEFRVWHDDSNCFYVMFDKDKNPIEISSYPIGSPAITNIMFPLMEFINKKTILKHKLFQIEFLSSQNDKCIVTLIYHKTLDETWIDIAKELEKKYKIHIVGRSRKQKICISQDFLKETFNVNNEKYKMIQQENSFTQPNASINERMMNWLCEHLSKENNDLLELYCGNGNFTIPLSRLFRSVLATEISKSNIKIAKKNCKLNQINNISFVRLSAEETTQALKKERDFRRLKDVDLNQFNFKTVLVDPPRSGLDNITLKLVGSFDKILYISCNPSTLKTNLIELTKSHDIIHFAIFDQFPYTRHCECGVILERRS